MSKPLGVDLPTADETTPWDFILSPLCVHPPRLEFFAPRNCVLAFSPGVLSAPRVGTPPPFLLEASELVLFPLFFVGCLLCVRLSFRFS